MNRTITGLLLPLFLTSTSLADTGPEAPPLATLEFTLDGKPFQPAVLSLNGASYRPSPGDLVRVGDLLLTLGPETVCAFRSTPQEDGRLWLRTSDGKERVVGARIGWTFMEDKKVVFNPLARLSDEEILELRGVLIDEWNDQIAERLRHIDRQRACVTITGNAGQPPGHSLPPVPSGLVYLNIESISGERFSDFSLLRKQAALRFLAVHTPGEVVDASDLKQAVHISYLDLSGNEVRNISELAVLTDLRTLDLAYARGVDTLFFASRLSRLSVLDIRDTQVRDLTPLDELKSLRRVDANRAPVRTMPRGTLPELRELQVLSTALADRTVTTFAAAHPRCRVQSHWMSTLRDALSGITRFRVRSGETYADSGKERTFFETQDAAQIAAFLNRIQIDETQSEFSCMCDTVGEFPAGSVWQEPGQAGSRWKGKSAAADALDEFAKSIHCYSRPSPVRLRAPVGERRCRSASRVRWRRGCLA
jgi:hypothetical protein